jgi:hypothetical protein
MSLIYNFWVAKAIAKPGIVGAGHQLQIDARRATSHDSWAFPLFMAVLTDATTLAGRTFFR